MDRRTNCTGVSMHMHIYIHGGLIAVYVYGKMSTISNREKLERYNSGGLVHENRLESNFSVLFEREQ